MGKNKEKDIILECQRCHMHFKSSEMKSINDKNGTNYNFCTECFKIIRIDRREYKQLSNYLLELVNGDEDKQAKLLKDINTVKKLHAKWSNKNILYALKYAYEYNNDDSKYFDFIESNIIYDIEENYSMGVNFFKVVETLRKQFTDEAIRAALNPEEPDYIIVTEEERQEISKMLYESEHKSKINMDCNVRTIYDED